MMKRLILAMAFVTAAGAAHASCFGSGSIKTCSDSSGNSYTVQQIGNTTYTNGFNSNTGSSWKLCPSS